MKKKAFALLLAASMVAGLAAGCGNSAGTTGTTGTENSSTTTTDSGDAYCVGISYITLGSDPTDKQMVEDAMSEYTMEKFGCTVELKSVPISNISSQYSLWASSGEKVDLLCLFTLNMGTLISDGAIICLDDYMTEENIPNILRISEERPFLSGGLYNGQQYAIPAVNPSDGEGKAMYALKEYMDTIDYEEKDVYTYDDLLSIFAQLKEQYPDMTPWAQQGALSSTMAEYFIADDNLGVTGALAGVLMDVGNGSTEVVDLFETDEYYEFLQFMQACYQNGYISSDAPTSTDAATDWIVARRSVGFGIGDDTPGNQENTTANYGGETVQLNIKPTYVTTSTYNGLNWGVSSSSENPALALKVYDELFAEDATLLNMIMNGIEGVHYITRENSKIVDYPEGIDGTNSPYLNLLGLYGDKRNMHMFAPNEDSFYTRSDEYTAEALTRQSAALGYTFDQTDYANEIAAVSAVMSQYLSSLEYGTVDDLDSYYQQFIGALKDAGIDTLVAANQEQLDAFLAGQQ